MCLNHHVIKKKNKKSVVWDHFGAFCLAWKMTLKLYHTWNSLGKKKSRKTDCIPENWKQLHNWVVFNNCLQIGIVSVPKLASKWLACSIVVPDSKISGAELDLDLVFYCAIVDEMLVPKMLKQEGFWHLRKQNCKGGVIRKNRVNDLYSLSTLGKTSIFFFSEVFYTIFIIFWSSILLFENDTFIILW